MAPKTLRERAAELGMKAMGKLFEDPRRAEAIAAAIGGLQRAKQALDEAQERALRAAGVGARGGFKGAGERNSALERGVRELAEEPGPVIPPPQHKKERGAHAPGRRGRRGR